MSRSAADYLYARDFHRFCAVIEDDPTQIADPFLYRTTEGNHYPKIKYYTTLLIYAIENKLYPYIKFLLAKSGANILQDKKYQLITFKLDYVLSDKDTYEERESEPETTAEKLLLKSKDENTIALFFEFICDNRLYETYIRFIADYLCVENISLSNFDAEQFQHFYQFGIPRKYYARRLLKENLLSRQARNVDKLLTEEAYIPKVVSGALPLETLHTFPSEDRREAYELIKNRSDQSKMRWILNSYPELDPPQVMTYQRQELERKEQEKELELERQASLKRKREEEVTRDRERARPSNIGIAIRIHARQLNELLRFHQTPPRRHTDKLKYDRLKQRFTGYDFFRKGAAKIEQDFEYLCKYHNEWDQEDKREARTQLNLMSQ